MISIRTTLITSLMICISFLTLNASWEAELDSWDRHNKIGIKYCPLPSHSPEKLKISGIVTFHSPPPDSQDLALAIPAQYAPELNYKLSRPYQLHTTISIRLFVEHHYVHFPSVCYTVDVPNISIPLSVHTVSFKEISTAPCVFHTYCTLIS